MKINKIFSRILIKERKKSVRARSVDNAEREKERKKNRLYNSVIVIGKLNKFKNEYVFEHIY